MDLVIFVVLITALSIFSVVISRALMRLKPRLIFMPSLILGFLFIGLIILTYVLDEEISILAAAFSFIIGPTAFITLIYASNQYFTYKQSQPKKNPTQD